jgi:hypothetical protein
VTPAPIGVRTPRRITTGFLVDTLDEAIEAIGRIGEIDRARCRTAVKACFTLDRMADRYLSLYRSLIEKA